MPLVTASQLSFYLHFIKKIDNLCVCFLNVIHKAMVTLLRLECKQPDSRRYDLFKFSHGFNEVCDVACYFNFSLNKGID